MEHLHDVRTKRRTTPNRQRRGTSRMGLLRRQRTNKRKLQPKHRLQPILHRMELTLDTSNLQLNHPQHRHSRRHNRRILQWPTSRTNRSNPLATTRIRRLRISLVRQFNTQHQPHRVPTPASNSIETRTVPGVFALYSIR